MKKSSVRIIILILVLAALVAWGVFQVGGFATGMSYPDEGKYTSGGTTVAGPVENLYVDWTSGLVNVEYHPGGGVIVSEEANRDLAEDEKLRWWLDGTTLRIRYAKSGLRISLNLNKKLTVSLPEGTVLKIADIGSTSADLNIPSLAAEEVTLGSTSGKISAGTAAAKVTASTTSGGISIRQTGDIGSVDLTATSGSISCSLESAGNVRAGSTSGDVSLTVSGKAGSVVLHSTSGSVTADIAAADAVESSSTSGTFRGRVAAFKELKINTTSGSVTADLPADPGFTCTVSTSSGSFSSDLALVHDGNTYTCGDGSARCRIDTSSGNIRIGSAE